MTLATERDTSRLVTDHQGLVRHIAKRFYVKGLEFDDLVSEGNIALLQAIEQFDATKIDRFSGYAGMVIENHLKKVLRRHKAMKRQADDQSSSIHTPVGGEEGGFTLLDVLEGRSTNPVQWTLAKDLQNTVMNLIRDPEVLPPSERTVILLTMQGLSLSEIAQQLGLANTVVNAQRTRARDKLSLQLYRYGYSEAFEIKSRHTERNETIAKWVAVARKNGVSENKFRSRLAIGWEPERAVLPDGSKLRKRFTDEDRELIRNKLLEGLNGGQIYEFFEGRSRQSVINLTSRIRKQLKAEGRL